MKSFFVLDGNIVGSPYETRFDKMEPVRRGQAQRCLVCDSPVSGLPWLPPFRAELKAYGKELGDIAFGPSDELLVSDRFRTAWEAANLRGLEFSPLERIRIRPARLGKKPRTYFHAVPRFFGTHVDIEHSTIERDDPISCSQCHYAGLTRSIRGMQIDEASWTGEDLFYAWGFCGTVIVTDRVRQLRDDHGLTNINLTPVEEFFWDPYNQWTPIDYSPDKAPTPDDTVLDELGEVN
jgi:hypothetical protein